MDNKKSLLQDSLQELENIKNESLELAKEQLINENADILEKKSAALFEKLISEDDEKEDVNFDEILNELKNLTKKNLKQTLPMMMRMMRMKRVMMRMKRVMMRMKRVVMRMKRVKRVILTLMMKKMNL
jgi:hypothetical protein